MVEPVWVDGEVSEEFAGGGVDDSDVEVVDEEDDAGSVEGSSESDVVELAVDAEGDCAGTDAVVADAVLEGWCGGGVRFWAGGVGDGGCGVAGEGSVGAVVVVVGDEGVELGLEFVDGCGWGLGA